MVRTMQTPPRQIPTLVVDDSPRGFEGDLCFPTGEPQSESGRHGQRRSRSARFGEVLAAGVGPSGCADARDEWD